MCNICGKVDRCGCCEDSPCSKCLDCFPLEYSVIKNPEKEDSCADILDKFKGRPNRGRCDMSIRTVVDGTKVTVYAVSNTNSSAKIEYSNNGVAFGDSNVFSDQPCGTHTYYARQADNGCMVNQRAIVTASCQECIPEWINFNPLDIKCEKDGYEYVRQYNTCNPEQRYLKTNRLCQPCSKTFVPYVPTFTFCQAGKIQQLEINDCKEVRAISTDMDCSECQEEWYIVPSVDPKCISGFRNIFEANVCGGVRWVVTQERCSDCVSDWRTDEPLYQECIGGTVRIRQTNDCDDERMYDTKIPCGGIVTPCSPSVSLSGVPSQICASDIISIDGSGLVAAGGSGSYRYALVKTSEFNGVENLTWTTSKVWSVTDYVTPFRIYVSSVGGSLQSTSCYAYINFNTIQCGGGGGQPVCAQNFVLTSVTSTATTANLTISGFGGVTSFLWRLKTTAGVVVKNGSSSISSSSVQVTYGGSSVAPGSYIMEIEASSCQSAVTSLPVTISGGGGGGVETEDPAIIGLTKFGFSFDAITNDSTIVAEGSSTNYQIQVKSLTAPIPLTGKTWNGTTDEAPFDESTWLINDTRNPSSTWPNMFRANAVVDGVDGMQKNSKYRVYIKHPLISGYVYIKDIDIPSSSTNGYLEIPITDGNDCAQGPTLITIISATPNNVVYQFHGNGVSAIRNRIKSGSTIIANTVSNPTSSAVTINLPSPLVAGSYTLEIEGENCSSNISSLPFIISNGSAIEPVIQASADGVFVTTRGTDVYYMNHGINTILKVTNMGTIRVEQQNGSPIPKTKTATNGTANLIIQRNERSLKEELVSKFIGAEGIPLVEDNFTLFTLYWGTVLTNAALDQRRHTPWQSWQITHSSPYFAGQNEYCQISRHKL